MVDFLKEHWEGVIATIAFLQFWAIKFYETHIRKAILDIHPSGNPEVGYSEFGPTMGIYGTFRARNEDVFIKRIRLRICRVRTNEEHWFVWVAFRSPVMTLGASVSPPPELPSSFIVSHTQPHRYNIVFQDPDVQRDIRPFLQRLAPLINEQSSQLNFARGSTNWPSIFSESLAEYQKTEQHLDAFEELNRQCYWQAGQYKLEIHIDTDRQDSQFFRKVAFRLTEEDVRRLRLNVTAMLVNPFRTMAGEQPWPFYFAYPDLEEGEP